MDQSTRYYQEKGIELLKSIDEIFTKKNIWYSLSYGCVLGAVREGGFIKWDQDIDIVIKETQKIEARHALLESLPSIYNVLSCDDDIVSSFDIIYIKDIPENKMHVDLYTLIGVPTNDIRGYKYQLLCRKIHRLLSCKYLKFNRLQAKWKLPFIVAVRGVLYLIPNNLLRKLVKHMSNKYPLEKTEYCVPFANDGIDGEIMKKDFIFNTKRIEFESLLLPVPKYSKEYLTAIYGSDYMTPKQY